MIIHSLTVLSTPLLSICVFFFVKLADNCSMIGKEIVERIDTLLIGKNIKRYALAETVGISVQAFSDWKSRGTIPAGDILLRIARYLNVSLEWLITGEDEEGLSPEIRALVEKIKILDQNDFKAVQQLVNVLAERYLADSALPEESSERLG